MCKHTVIEMLYFVIYGYYKGLKQQKSPVLLKVFGNSAIW